MTFAIGEEVYHSTFGIGTVKESPSEGIIVVKFGPTSRTIKSCFLREVTDNLRPAPAIKSTWLFDNGKKEAEMLKLLREAGKEGVPNINFVNNDEIGHRFSVTVQSLREKGFKIQTVKLDRRTFKTVLLSEPES